MSKEKLSKAIARVQGAQGLQEVISEDSFIEVLSPEFLENVTLERIVKLEDGQGLRGMFLGAGAFIETTSLETGEVVNLPTWRIEVRPSQVARLIGTYQLNQAFSIMPPSTMVRVARLGMVETKNKRRVTDYVVAVEKPAKTLQLDIPHA